MSKSEMEMLTRKAWPNCGKPDINLEQKRACVDTLGLVDGNWKTCCVSVRHHEKAIAASLAALRVLAGEEAPELAALRAENELLKRELAEATHSLDFTQQWYAERLQRLRDLAREMGRERDHCAIVANGSMMGEPPTYAQQLNLAKYRADKAESDLREAQATIERLRSTPPRPGWVAVGVLRELAHDWENRAACIMADVGEGHQDSIDAERLMACADELTAIADTAGDAEAVERAAFELVETAYAWEDRLEDCEVSDSAKHDQEAKS